MLGTIGFKGYVVNCIIGTEDYERNQEQDLIIDLKVEIDFSNASVSGRLEDTINYVSLAEICKCRAIEGRYHLIENYATDVVLEMIQLFPVKSVWIRIKKPLAIPGAECALVELKQER